MVVRRWCVVAVWIVMSLASAGCVDEAPAPDSDDATAPPFTPAAPPAPVVATWTGSTTGSQSTDYVQGSGFTDRVPFQVEANATLLHVELRWDDDVQDIDLVLKEPDSGYYWYTDRAYAGSTGAPDSPHSLTIRDPFEGEWLASATSGEGAMVHVEWEVSVSVFYGQNAVPDGYSGFDA